MATYSTEEVIALHYEYKRYADSAVPTYLEKQETPKLFAEWLRAKEQAQMQCSVFDIEALEQRTKQLPVKGQIIWVRDKFIGHTWIQREFDSFSSDNKAICKTKQGAIYMWDEYSTTDPNK
jgi:hypothetical protein